MSVFHRLSLVMAASMLAAGAQAAVSIDANLEADPTFKGSTATPKAKNDSYLGGRVEINANAALVKQGDNFVNARASLIVPLNGNSVAMDDAWIQFGNSKADFKLGRQEAADLFPLGKDTVVERVGAASGYWGNKLRGRLTDGRIHGVVGLNAAPGLRVELGVVTQKNGSASDYGLRPTVVYNAGALTLRAGFESFKTEGAATGTSKTGMGLSMGYAVNKDTNVNLNYAKSSKLNATSFGANAVFGAAGVGYIQDRNTLLKTQVNTVYVAYSMPLLGVPNATITPALSHSTGTKVSGLTAVRVRLNYAF